MVQTNPLAMMSTAPAPLSGNALIGTILRHDRKITSYKIALLRSINDVVLAFPDMVDGEGSGDQSQGIALPLRMLAEFWVAYYFPFTDPQSPILQGQIMVREGEVRDDVSFRPALEVLRLQWEKIIGSMALPSDGFFLLSEMRTPRRRLSYPKELQNAHHATARACIDALQQPIRYAGQGQYTVFAKPRKLVELGTHVKAVPGTLPNEQCLVLSAQLWVPSGNFLCGSKPSRFTNGACLPSG